MRGKALLSVVLAGTLTLFGCNKQEETTNSQKNENTLTIYTTVYPLQDFAEKIGGEHVNVQSIYPPGADAHTFEPTTKTMQQLADADAFIYIGQGMEGFVDRVTKTLTNENVKLVEATKGIELIDSTHDDHAHEDEATHDEHAHEDETANDEYEHHHGDKDPHVWLDPIYAIEMAETIKNTLSELKPEAKDEFEQNFAALKSELEALDAQFKELVANAKRKEILVAHAAYGYWEKRYGIEQISVTGLSPTNEPSQKQLANIIKTAKKHNIRYIFFEQSVTPKIAEVVKNEIGAEPLRLHNLESLTEEDVKEKKDYITIMKENVENLRKALQ
ncbi:zinc transport system substrate-binding protein [Thermolongibacillus altinsuensis]|uniref:Zinc transport system substrate-binding protein n=1 Tax=Thermolongibacillus altinsuensis TaxID=575256 RepID=A0A4R1QDP6_9BACL|nr:metal ABC transporter substrate-binding protein [Thermolongibacillus altinsuensis]TCL46535.1 zinc transport system substrate-binding protein [Thermolongibacillus altinsuensis]